LHLFPVLEASFCQKKVKIVLPLYSYIQNVQKQRNFQTDMVGRFPYFPQRICRFFFESPNPPTLRIYLGKTVKICEIGRLHKQIKGTVEYEVIFGALQVLHIWTTYIVYTFSYFRSRDINSYPECHQEPRVNNSPVI
jgi:hypothetical protein